MLSGAGLQVLGIVITLLNVGALKSQIRRQLENNGTIVTESRVNAVYGVAVAVVLIVGLVGAGLWVWMAVKNRSGRNWARILSTVFFGFLCISTLTDVVTRTTRREGSSTLTASTSTNAASLIIGLALFLVGLGAIILLWYKDSGPHFVQPVFTGYGYPAPSYGPLANGYPYAPPPADQPPPEARQQPPAPDQTPPPPGSPGDFQPPQ
jgi:hypothetical protein